MNNVAALEILMDCGYSRAIALVIIGAVARAAVGWWMLSAIGLQDKVWGLGEMRMTLVPDGVLDFLNWVGSWS